MNKKKKDKLRRERERESDAWTNVGFLILISNYVPTVSYKR